MDQQRRQLLTTTLAAAGLTIGGPLLTAADGIVSFLEVAPDEGRALAAAEASLLAAACGHMLPTTTPKEMQALAVGVQRDAAAIADHGAGPLAGPARYVEAMAAGLVAQIYGELRCWSLASPLFTHATTKANEAVALGDPRGHAAAALVQTMAARVVMYTMPGHAAEAERRAFNAWALAADVDRPEGGGYQAVLALAPSVVARSRALQGNGAGALDALTRAEEWLGAPGYEHAPRPKGGDATAAMSAFGYGERAHHFTRAEVLGLIGQTEEAASAAHAYLHGTETGGKHERPASNTSVNTLAFGRAWGLGMAGKVDESADRAHDLLVRMPDDQRTPTVMTRAGELFTLLHRKAGGAAPPRSVDRYGGLLSRMNVPLTSATAEV